MANELALMYNQDGKEIQKLPCNSGDWRKPMRTAIDRDAMYLKSVVKLVFRGAEWEKDPDELRIVDFKPVPAIPKKIEPTVLHLEHVKGFEIIAYDYDGLNGKSKGIYQQEANANYDSQSIDSSRVVSLDNLYTDGTNLFIVVSTKEKFVDLDTELYEKTKLESIKNKLNPGELDFLLSKMR